MSSYDQEELAPFISPCDLHHRSWLLIRTSLLRIQLRFPEEGHVAVGAIISSILY